MNKTLRRSNLTQAAKDALDTVVDSLAHIKIAKDQAESDRKEVAPVALERMKEAGVAKHRIPWSDEHDAVAAIKTRDNSKVDPERLKKAIGAKQFHKLTSEHLDDEKIEAAIQLGELDANVVAQCVDESKTEYVEVRFLKARKK